MEAISKSSKNLYTDQPELSKELITRTIQLLSWLYFHPSAWRNCVSRIDPNLRSDFVLVDLSREHWNHEQVKKMIRSALTALLAAAIAFMGLMFLFDMPGKYIVGYMFANVFVVISSMSLGWVYALVLCLLFMPPGYFSAAKDVQSSIIILSFLLVTAISAHWRTVLPDNFFQEERGTELSSFIIGIFTAIAVIISWEGFGLPFASSFPSIDLIPYALTMGLLVIFLFLYVSRQRNNHVRSGAILCIVVILGLFWPILWLENKASLIAFQISGAEYFVKFFSLASFVLAALFYQIVFGSSRSHRGHPYTMQVASWLAAAMSSAVCLAWFTVKLGGYKPEVFWWSILAILLGFTFNLWRSKVAGLLPSLWNFYVYRWAVRWINQVKNSEEMPTDVPLKRGARLMSGIRRINLESLSGSKDINSLLHRNAAFWDERLSQRSPRLYEHLLLVEEYFPDELPAALNYLDKSAHQSWAASLLRFKNSTESLRSASNIHDIGRLNGKISISELSILEPYFKELSEISAQVGWVLLQETFREQFPELQRVAGKIAWLNEQVKDKRSQNPFVPNRRQANFNGSYRILSEQIKILIEITNAWKEIIWNEVDRLQAEIEKEIINPFCFGQIVGSKENDPFIGRQDIFSKIREILTAETRIAILLLGPKRMGKSSILYRLKHHLPATFTPFYLDCQAIQPASDAEEFARAFCERLCDWPCENQKFKCPTIPQISSQENPFFWINRWLDSLEQALAREGKDGILMLDEFKSLGITGRYTIEDFLSTLRHNIQHRKRLRFLLAGSHSLDETPVWNTYLGNFLTIRVGFLDEASTRQLIERPTPDFNLKYESQAVDRIAQITRGHPTFIHLLIGNQLIPMKKHQPPPSRFLVLSSEVDKCIDEAVRSSATIYQQILEDDETDNACNIILRFIAALGEGERVKESVLINEFGDNVKPILYHLRKRQLLDMVNGEWQFQVELMRRWFALDPYFLQ